MVHHPLWIKLLLLGWFFVRRPLTFLPWLFLYGLAVPGALVLAVLLPLTVIFRWLLLSDLAPYLELGPQGPLVIPPLDAPVHLQEKSGSLIYRHICLMNHQKTHQTNQSRGISQTSHLTPWDPRPPFDPLWTPKHPPWPQWILKITCTALQMIRGPINCRQWSYWTP